MVKESILKKSITFVVAAAIAASAFMALPIAAGASGPGKSDAAMAAKPGTSSIVDIVLLPDGEFDVLQAAVVKAGLVDALSGGRQYTVFAPTDQAFANAFGGTEASALAAVDAASVEYLQNVLLYHVMPGRHTSTSVLARSQYRMLNGAWLTKSELVPVPNKLDQSASNGVIHVISEVLIP